MSNLDVAVANHLAEDWRVEYESPQGIVLVKRPRNDGIATVIHLLLTIVTLGLWLPVWIVDATIHRVRRVMLSADPWGRVQIRRL